MFSIIIPNYNRKEKVVNAINSVLDQTYPDFELLVVDDCSTDSSLQEISKINDPRLLVFKLEKNSGAAAARNFGIEKAKGNFISFLDSDDFFDPNFLKESLKTLKGTPEKVGFMWTGVRYIQKGKASEYIWKPELKSSSYQTFLHSLHIGTNSGITLKKEVITKCGKFREDLPAAEDTEFFLRITQEFDFTLNPKILINIEKDASDRLSINFRKIAIAYNKFLPDHYGVIDKEPKLQGKYNYKMMWLNFQIENGTKALLFYEQIPKEYRSFKVRFIKLLYENLPLKAAAFIHQKFSS